jgi:signal peptidase I
MDIDFSLVLVVATGAAFVLWLIDRLWFAPGRNQRRQSLQLEYPGWDQSGSEDQRKYAAVLDSQVRQPALFEYAASFLPVLAIVLVLRSFLVEPFQIPSASMVPTLEVGDFILVNKFTYGLRLPVVGTKVLALGEPQRGDVMVFFPPNDKRYFIKRVIGLPGDRIEIRNKVLTINGEPAPQSLLAELPAGRPSYQLRKEDLLGVEHTVRTELYKPRGRTPLGYDPDNLSLTVAPGYYFMMGDNRDNSSDSRFWGQVPEQNVVGKAFAIWMHWDSFFSIPAFNRVGRIE